jgi:TIR domain
LTNADKEGRTTSGIQLPGVDALPPGPLRQLTEALHELYRAAGKPALRKVADAVRKGDFRGTASHQKVAELLHGEGVPTWSSLECVVRVLAGWATPSRDADVVVAGFKQLWDVLAGEESLQGSATVQGVVRIRSVFVLGGVTGETGYPTYEPKVLEQFCNRLGIVLARANIDLVACSPFPDSADFHTLWGYLESGAGIVHMHRPRGESIDQQVRELSNLLGVEKAGRIKEWFYPEPEAAGDEARRQAWLLCQLMAIEQASLIVAVGGRLGHTASTILHLAEARRLPVLPFTFLGGAAEQAFRRRDWGHIYPSLDVTRLSDKDAVDEVVDLANQMVTDRMKPGGPPGRPRSVFISRARLDVEYAQPLDRYLSEIGLTVLFGERELPAEKTVEAAIEDAVLRSDLFVVLWSRSYAASRYCYDEFHLAIRRNQAGQARLWVINLDGSDIVPPEGRHLQPLQARTPQQVVQIARDLLSGIP